MKTVTSLFCVLLAHFTFGQTIEWSQKANPANLSINSVAFDPTGQQVISGTNCHPASIRLFDVATGNLEWDYTVGSSFLCIMGVAISSNNNYIAAIEEFGNIFLFDNSGATPIIIDTVNTGTSYGFSTAISPLNDHLVVGCSNGKMKIYAIPSDTVISDVSAHPSWVTSVTYSPDGTKIISGGNDDKVKIWNSDGTLLFICSGHTGDITNVRVSPNNLFVYSSSKDNSIKKWDIQTGALLQTLSDHTNDVNGIDLSPDGNKLVSGSSDKTCKIWDLETGNVISTFGVIDSGIVNTVAWSPQGDKIVSGNIVSDLVLWNIPQDLGIAHHNFFEFYVSPNPTTDFITIQTKKELKIESIEILDISGKKMFTLNGKQEKIDVSKLYSGVYFIKVKLNSGEIGRKKFTKL